MPKPYEPQQPKLPIGAICMPKLAAPQQLKSILETTVVIREPSARTSKAVTVLTWTFDKTKINSALILKKLGEKI
jgi:hypothetical protein